jgi:hypothetical protein
MDHEVIRIIPNFISVIQPFQEKGFGLPDLLTLQIHQVWNSGVTSSEPVRKVIFCRLIKNARMQGARNPEE